MKTQAGLWAVMACAGLVAGQAQAKSSTEVRQVVVRPSPIHIVPEDPAAIDANPILNPGLHRGLKVASISAPVVAVLEPTAVSELAAEPVPAGPKVGVARVIVDAAGAFDGYMRRAAAIKADFGDGDSVSRAVTLGSVYEPGQLERGAIAYAALLALQDARFVQVVHDLGEDPAARDEFAARLATQPQAVLDAPAARRAAGRVSAVLGRMGVDLVTAGAAVKQAAYDVQKQDWSRQAIAGPDTRLERIRAQSSRPVTLAPADTAHLIAGLSAMQAPGLAPRTTDAVSPVVARGLAVAALAVLGRAGEDQAEQVAPLLTEAEDSRCIKMAQLNLMQCLAVVGPQYENAFCLGRHAMMDTGRCVATAAGLTEADLKPATDTRSVLVPIALASASGPERDSVMGERPASGATPSGGLGDSPVEAAPTPSTDVAVPIAAAPVAVAVVPAAYSPYAGPTER